MEKISNTKGEPLFYKALSMYRVGYNTPTQAWYEFMPFGDYSLHLSLRSENKILWQTSVGEHEYGSLVDTKIFAPTFEELTCKGEQRLPTSILARDYSNPNDTQEYAWDLSAWRDNFGMVCASYFSQDECFYLPDGHTLNAYGKYAIDAMCDLWIKFYENNAKRLMGIKAQYSVKI